MSGKTALYEEWKKNNNSSLTIPTTMNLETRDAESHPCVGNPSAIYIWFPRSPEELQPACQYRMYIPEVAQGGVIVGRKKNKTVNHLLVSTP